MENTQIKFGNPMPKELVYKILMPLKMTREL